MASPQPSAQSSSTTIPQLIEEIINTKHDEPNFDLDKLISDIDTLLKLHQDGPSKKGKSKGDRLHSASDNAPAGAEISEGVSENVEILAKEISQFSGDEHSTAINVLEAAGTVHWAGLCLLLVAAVLKSLNTMEKNKMERLDLLKSMNELAKVVRNLKEIPRAKDEMKPQINDSIAVVVEGAIQCCSQTKTKWMPSFLNARKHRDKLIALRTKVDEMYKRVELNMVQQNLSRSEEIKSILENSPNVQQCNHPQIPSARHAVGIQEQVDEVVKLLQWENDTPSVAVVVHGFGGSGKTTLADAVYHSLTDKLSGWKYSKIVLIENLEEHPDVKILQSNILQDLTGRKEEVRDLETGRQRLKEVMEKQSIFLYIDNALFIKPLQELLPREITNPKKLRLLLTARETLISDVMEDCKIKYEVYSIEPLPVNAAIQVLNRKICSQRDTHSLSKERPEIEVIAQKCSSCPLFLEVVGGFLRRRGNKDEAFERVLQWMENGKPFSGHKEDKFDQERIMFAYDQLELSAQEAFLDICSFFNGWDWEDVAHIVGEEEMKCLHEGALIKRKQERSWVGIILSKVVIHDLLLSVGRHKSKDNRFRTPEEFTKFLQKEGKSHSQVKGVWLTNMGECRGPIDIRAEVLDEMSGSLRVFAMGKWTLVEGRCSKSFGELRFLKAEPGSDLPMDLSKLSRLTYISCSWEENIKSSEHLKGMPQLKVVHVTEFPSTWNSSEISELGYFRELRVLALSKFWGKEIPDLVNLGHLRKLDLSHSYQLLQLPGSLGKLTSLEELYLSWCTSLEHLPLGFGKQKALVVLDLKGCEGLKELPMDFVNLSNLQRLNLESCKSLRVLPSSFEKLASLQYLNLKSCSELISLPERLGDLTRLTEIYFSECTKLTSLPQSLGGLSSLLMSKMFFQKCSSLTVLPEETSWLSKKTEILFQQCESIEELCSDFHRLDALRILKMCGCRSLSTLPQGFGKLKSLQDLDLSGCDNLKKLCDDFHCLAELKVLNLARCRGITKLPDHFGELKSLQDLNLSECDSLGELCSNFHRLEELLVLDLSRCRGITKLPDHFGELKSLQHLNLSECDSLGELCSNFHRLEELLVLDLSRCCSIAKLPNSFGELQRLQTLNLSQCSKLEELCNDFHFLKELEKLDMSGCNSLTKLSDSFGHLRCLEKADFRGCSNLAKLSDDFQNLPSLVRLDLSNCKRLGEEWMDRVGATQSLLYVDISGSEAMTQRWERMQRQKQEWHFVVETDLFFEPRDWSTSRMGPSEKQRDFVLDKIIWKIFSTEGLLIDADQRPFYASSLPSDGRLVLITESFWSSVKPNKFIMALSNLELLEKCSSESLKIIYVGGEFNVLPSEVADRIVAHSTSSSWIDSVRNCFHDVLPHSFFSHSVFATTTDVGERGTVKWKDISYIVDKSGVEFLTRHPRDGNTKLLRKLCETPENGFLLRKNVKDLHKNVKDLHKNEKVEVEDLEGKLVLLFRKHSSMVDKLNILALEDVYLKLQTSSDYRAEVVWIPKLDRFEDPKEYIKSAARAPWPMVPNPWSVDEKTWSWAHCLGKGEGLVVVDEKGSISNRDAMPMILRWGINAYPFSASREEELRDAQWKEFNSSSQSSLQFIFQNVEHFQLKTREALRRGEMMFMCVGSISKMLEFLPQLNNALTKLENAVVQVFYVGEGVPYSPFRTTRFYEEEEEYETKRKEMDRVTSLSLCDAYKFWEHAKCLWDELKGKGVDKRIAQVRSMVLAFLSTCKWKWGSEEEKGIRIVAVDESGEMMNGQAEEIVQLLCQSEPEDEHQKLMGEIKSEGFSDVLGRRWRDGRIHPKHDPHHPLVPINALPCSNRNYVCDACFSIRRQCDACYSDYTCDACSEFKKGKFYRCSVCEKYKMCQDCFEC